MSLLQTGTKFVGGWASGLNWYKLAAEAIIVVSVVTGAYAYGVHNCEIKHEQRATAAAKSETKAVIRQVQVRVPEVQKLDRVANEKHQAIKVTGEKLNETFTKNPTGSGCHFTDEQLQLYRQLAEATH